MYTNIDNYCSNNGFTWILCCEPKRGIRQGCPVSVLLLIMVAKIFATNVRSNEGVRGITVDDNEFVISQLAGDITLFLNGTESLVDALSLNIEDVHSVSGLMLNL